jgi:hypothetical protein
MVSPLPFLSFDAALLPYGIVAVSMVVVTIFVLTHLLRRDGTAPLLSTMTIGVAVLAGGSLLLLSLLYVFVNPDQTTAWTWVLLAFNFMMMAPAGLWFVSVVVFRDRRVERLSWVWPVVLSLVTVGSEALMGVLFATAAGAGPPTPVAGLAGGLTSVWFDWSMAAIMASLVFWLPIRGVVRGTLGALTAAALLAPWVTASPVEGVVGMAALMALVLLFLYRYLRARLGPSLPDLSVVLWLGAAFVVMVAAQASILVTPSSVLASIAFGGAMAVVMGGEFVAVARRTLVGPGVSAPEAWVGPRPTPVSLPGPIREP